MVATDILEYMSCGIANQDLAIKHRITLMHTAIAAGSDTLSIFENKDFLITEVLGSKEIKKDGTPTVRVFIKLIWIGANGYGIEKNNKNG